MGENVLLRPARQVEPGPVGQEAETGLRQFGAAFPRQQDVQLLLQRVQMEHVGGRIGHLRLGQLPRRPNRRLLLLGQVDARARRAPDPSVRACPYRCGSAARRSWCNRRGVGITPSAWYSDGESNRAKWKILATAGSASSRFRLGASLAVARNLHDVGRAVAGRELDHAQPVAMRVEPHGLGVDRDHVLVAREIGEIAAVQADGHEITSDRDQARMVPRRGLEPPRLLTTGT